MFDNLNELATFLMAGDDKNALLRTNQIIQKTPAEVCLWRLSYIYIYVYALLTIINVCMRMYLFKLFCFVSPIFSFIDTNIY